MLPEAEKLEGETYRDGLVREVGWATGLDAAKDYLISHAPKAHVQFAEECEGPRQGDVTVLEFYVCELFRRGRAKLAETDGVTWLTAGDLEAGEAHGKPLAGRQLALMKRADLLPPAGRLTGCSTTTPPPPTLRERMAPLELNRLFVGPPHPHVWTVWLMATPLLMGAALFFDVFPREGTDGQWLLGWPVVVGTHSQADGFTVTRAGGDRDGGPTRRLRRRHRGGRVAAAGEPRRTRGCRTRHEQRPNSASSACRTG